MFDADASPGVVVALSDMRDRFRLVANAVDVVPLDEPLPNLPVARALWEPKPDFAEIAKTELLTIDEGRRLFTGSRRALTDSKSRRNERGSWLLTEDSCSQISTRLRAFSRGA